jgi:Arc/MetJ-type ribon-helix-helix transcriptional regulator
VKLSISLPPADVEFLDSYTQHHGFDSRSAAVQRAIRLLRAAELGDEYEAAWDEWEKSGDADLWEVTAGDGLRNE